MRRSNILLILLFLLLSTASLAYKWDEFSAGTIEDPQPIISVSFGERPVTITEHFLILQGESLTDHSSLPQLAQEPYNCDDNGCRDFNFTVSRDDWLFNGDYLFFLKAKDRLDNEVWVNLTFTIDSPAPPIYVTQPDNPYIDNATFAMAQTRVFDLTVHIPTIPAASCKWDPRSEGDYTRPSPDSYANLIGDFGPPTGGGHYFTITGFDYFAPGQGNVPSGELVDFIVMCRDMNDDYSAQVITLGWDDTPPEFSETNTNFTPDKIDDFAHRQTVLSTTTDDLTVCAYENTEHPPGLLPGPYTAFPNPIVTSYLDFTKEKELSMRFDGVPNLDGTPGTYPAIDYQHPGPYTYAVEVTCSNIAGLTSSTTRTIPIELDQELVITLISPRSGYAQSSADFVFTTNVDAECTLEVEGKDSKKSTGTEHEHAVSGLEQGDNDYLITCTQFFGTETGVVTETLAGTVTVDTGAPSVALINFTHDEPLCGDERRITYEVEAADEVSGIDYYNITLSFADEEATIIIDDDGRATGSYLIGADLEPGDHIDIEAYAVDRAGNEGMAGSDRTQYQDASHIDCDRTPPDTSDSYVRPSETGTSYKLNITCRDNEGGSGCDDTVHTAPSVGIGEPCTTNQSAYAASSYDVNKEYPISTIERVCYYVQDKAGNKAYGHLDAEAAIGITLINPEFGISPNQTFDLIVETYKDATCKHGTYIDAHKDLGHPARYNALSSDKTFTTTGAKTHAEPGYDELAGHGFSYEREILIACTDGNLYDSAVITLGYDTTPPIITLTIEPATLRNQGDLFATLTIETDEESLCTYERTVGDNPYHDVTATTHNFHDNEREEHWNLHERAHYQDTPYEQELPEQYLFPLPRSFAENGLSYTYTATCTNLAGKNNTAAATLTVNRPQNVAINVGTPDWVTSTSVTINASTPGLTTTCDYAIDGGEEQPMRPEKGEYHEATVNLPESKTYALTITCQDATSPAVEGSASKTIRVDLKDPSAVNITASSPTCGLADAPEVRFQATDEGSGIDHYEYELTIGRETTPFQTTHDRIALPVETPLEEGELIGLRARAIDRAGRTGPWTTYKDDDGNNGILATTENDVLCDFTNPVGSIRTEDTLQGIDVTVLCEDEGSGCDPDYYYTLLPLGESCDDATYTSRKALGTAVSITEDQLLCWQVKDLRGNTDTGSFDAKVSFELWIEEPLHGIAPTKTFDLVAGTDRAATCKLDFLSSTHPTDLQVWYGQLRYAFAPTGGSVHRYDDLNLEAMGASKCAGKEECEQTIAIICKEGARYHHGTFGIGYDTTPPSITAAITPNPLHDLGKQTLLRVTSPDDPVWCRYEDKTNGESGYFTQYPDLHEKSSYQYELEQDLGYFYHGENGEPYDVDYEVTCINLAGLTDEQNVTLRVNPSDDIGITINTASPQDATAITIDITTLLDATCSYRFNQEHPYKECATTGGTHHESSHRFDKDGTYELDVYCEKDEKEGTAGKTIIVDHTAPTMTDIITADHTCSLTGIKATLMANASVIGLQAYNYSVIGPDSELIVPWQRYPAGTTATIEHALTLAEGERYVIQAKAIDKLSRESPAISVATIASDEHHENCDDQDPTASVDIKEVYGGVDAYVGCKDDESGCTDHFDFHHLLATSTDACADGVYTSEPYNQLPLFLETSGTACAKVYDKAGNTDDASASFTIIPWCSNGIQDPEEEGVDCGGPCPASCNDCANGRQDENEEGVDCGGVCPTSCEDVANCGDGVVGGNEECDGEPPELTCEDLLFAGGTTGCTDTCELDTTNCQPSTTGMCGDGFVGPGETCDGGVGGMTCEDFGLVSGDLSCTSCQFDTTSCHSGYCGDGEIDAGESCDGTNWGEVASCKDISSDFSGGMPTCGADCHFDTKTCTEREGVDPGRGVCFYDEDCPDGICVDNVCVPKEEPSEPPEGEECDADDDCDEEEECINGKCWPVSEQERHTLGLILLLIGILLILGGSGYLVYTTYINPQPTLAAGGSLPVPQPDLSPEELERRRAARLAEMKRRQELQEAARRKAQQQKTKQRRELISAFKEDSFLKEQEPRKQPANQEQKKPAPAKKQVSTTKEKPAAKQPLRAPVKPKEDVFTRLDTITRPSRAEKPTSDEVFSELSEITGHSKNKLRTAINIEGVKGKDFAELYKDAQKKDVTPRHVTTTLNHLVDKGKLDHDEARQAVHHLARQDKLTDNQKQQALKGLTKQEAQ
ncbi:hypothetical protein JXA12_02560 [Candidatus Woesearchaeota archaeon]|nr:hypothetical protein [Candidatus Woesearchaeota archaeon]